MPTAALLAFALAAASASSEPRPVLSRSNRRDGLAIVIGIERYRDRLPEAKFARHDAEAFSAFAQATLGIPKARIRTLLDDHATSADIQDALAWAQQNATAQSSVVFYFSGHGTPSLKSGEPMLVPFDADPNEVDRRGLPIQALGQALASVPGKEKLVFLDACFSGTGDRSLISAGKRPLVPVKALPEAKGPLLVFSATSARGVSGPSHKAAHGLFTYHLLQGLRGAADVDANNQVTAAELARYVRQNVMAEAKEAGGEQEPQASLGDNGVLAVVDDPGPDAPGFGGEEAPKSPAPAPAPAPPPGTAPFKPEELQRGCDQKVGRRCTELGLLYEKGRGVTRDDLRAAQYYRQGCDAGDATGCSSLGDFFDSGRGVAQDSSLAASLYRQACEGGVLRGCFNLGVLHVEGRGVARDETRAAALYRQACEGGYLGGCSNLGWLYGRGLGVARDDARAAALYRKACEGGYAAGCSSLGYLYEKGQGVARDDTQAAALYRQACEGGFPRGCSFLGDFLTEGRGVGRDEAQAATFHRRGCEGGYLGGCHMLGYAYEGGRGVTQDFLQAASLYRKACDGGEMKACTSLGYLYGNGRGLARDDARALALYRQGCEGGDAQGCSNLANRYRDGNGTAREPALAKKYFQRACELGEKQSCSESGGATGNSGPAGGQRCDLNGTWTCQGSRCAPQGGKTHITQSGSALTLSNEFGKSATGTSSGNQVTTSWGVTATVSADCHTLDWHNATLWVR